MDLMHVNERIMTAMAERMGSMVGMTMAVKSLSSGVNQSRLFHFAWKRICERQKLLAERD